MKKITLLLATLFLSGCIGTLNPYTKQIDELERLYSEDKISANDYLTHKTTLTEKEQQWQRDYYARSAKPIEDLKEEQRYQDEMRMRAYEASQQQRQLQEPIKVKVVE